MTKPDDVNPPLDNPNQQGVALSMNLIKSLNKKRKKTFSSKDSDGGASSSSNHSNAGHASDNSALVSLGNTSFGFNFDSEEANSGGDSDEGKGVGNSSSDNARTTRPTNTQHSTSVPQHHQQRHQISSDNGSDRGKSTSSMASSLSSRDGGNGTSSSNSAHRNAASHKMAADQAVANLHSIASQYMQKDHMGNNNQYHEKAPEGNKADNDSNGGYNTDDEGVRPGMDRKIATSRHPDIKATKTAPSSTHSVTSSAADMSAMNPAVTVSSSDPSSNTDAALEPPEKKKKGTNEKKREERNAREKERSFRISKQIDQVRELLSSGGVIVPKGTKSSVLTEAANYIRMLQQHQYRSEIDRHQLVQQIQMIGSGAHGPQAAQAIRHVAAKNGVWSLGNFGGVPPKSAMGYYNPESKEEAAMEHQHTDPIQQTKIEEHEYRSVFTNCAVGMAIASMGGAFIDCNNLFCQLSNYTKQEVCALTIFNMTARQDLQHAFDLISQMISPPMESGDPQPIVLRGAMNNRDDLGLGVAIVKGDDGIAKFFCVTLIKNPASPFDDAKPIPATIELIQGTLPIARQVVSNSGSGEGALDSTPAFTSG